MADDNRPAGGAPQGGQPEGEPSRDQQGGDAPSPGESTRSSERRKGLGRRVAALIAALACVGLFWAINQSPGWAAWQFLTEDFDPMVRLVNIALLAGLFFNLAAALFDTGLWRGLRDAAGATFGLVVLARAFVLFPFAVAEDSTGEVVIRVVLGLSMIGAFIGVVAGWGLIARELHLRTNYRR